MKVSHIDDLELHALPERSISRFWLKLVTDGLGRPIEIPIIVAKGKDNGKVIGISAAIHGNELNGIPVVQRVFKDIELDKISGTIIGIPVLNVPSYLRKKRKFIDGTDLNHIMPGLDKGNVSNIYARRIMEKVVTHLDYLLDLHTASNGRINSYYIRADMSDEIVREMALLQNAQIVVHNPPNDGTLRGAAADLGIPAITLEVGDPNLFQKGLIRTSLTGIFNVLGHFGFLDTEIEEGKDETVLCQKSYWIYTDQGGLLTVFPHVADRVKKGQLIAEMRNIFGDLTRKYHAPENGIVIGKSVSPVNQTGGRILHLGVSKKMDADF